MCQLGKNEVNTNSKDSAEIRTVRTRNRGWSPLEWRRQFASEPGRTGEPEPWWWCGGGWRWWRTECSHGPLRWESLQSHVSIIFKCVCVYVNIYYLKRKSSVCKIVCGPENRSLLAGEAVALFLFADMSSMLWRGVQSLVRCEGLHALTVAYR